MAKKIKQITVSNFESAASTNSEKFVEVNWNGIDIVVSPTLPLKEMLEFVSNVSESCFDSEGNYIPEVWDFAIKHNIITKYTNLTLPKSMEKQYELLCSTNVCDFILQHVNASQFNAINRAIDRKVKYLVDARVDKINADIHKIISTFTSLQEQLSVALGNLADVDMTDLLEKFSNLSEEKIVKEYASNLASLENEGRESENSVEVND